MKILHLAAGKISGGASRGAYWLHRGLLQLGVKSFFLTNSFEKLSDDSSTTLAYNKAQKLKFLMLSSLGGIPKYIYNKREPWMFNTGFDGIDFTKHPTYSEADILHLHWVNGLVAMQTLRKVKKPIVWTLRDMWPMTGGCHVGEAFGCSRYIVGCGKCPQLKSNLNFDLSRLVILNKKNSLPPNTRIIGISNWLSDCARRSELFRDSDINTIYNNIDTDELKPINKNISRDILGLPKEKKVILIGATSLNLFYKGIDLFIESLEYLNTKDIHIVMFGESTNLLDNSKEYTIHKFGYLTDVHTLRLIYSAADVFVAPSRMDAFGKVIAESMSCGTPVVCFNATGPSDIVDHQVTGYKAKPFEPEDLANGVEWILSADEERANLLRKESRDRAVRLFDSRVIADQYIKLYEELLNKQ